MNREVLIQSLQDAPAILQDLVDSVPEDKVSARPREGIWTILEHLHHLGATQIMLGQRIKSFLTDDRPKIIPFIPDGDNTPNVQGKSADDLLKTYEHARKEQIEDLQSAPDAIWAKRADHPEYETYNFGILVRHILLHDFFHFYRIEELAFLKEENISDL